MNDNEIVAVDNSTAPSLNNQFDIVDVGAAEAFMNNYQELVNALLDDSDYQPIQTREGIKKSKKKSAWRKLATAFNISDDIIKEEIKRDECDRIINAHFVVKATLPNGRYGMGSGACSIYDKITKKDTKEPTPFELRQRFTNAEHDVISTAHTRAKSRAISDLIGAGEISAEELSGLNNKPKSKPKPAKPKTTGKTSTMGIKPKKTAPKKAPSKKTPKPKIDDEAIEVEPVEVHDMSGDKTSMSLKEIIDSNTKIRLAVDELQAQGSTPNRDNIKAKLLDLNEMGKVTTEEYKQCKELLE